MVHTCPPGYLLRQGLVNVTNACATSLLHPTDLQGLPGLLERLWSFFFSEIEANMKAGGGGPEGSGPSKQKDSPLRHYQRPLACCWNPSNFVITPGSLSPGGGQKLSSRRYFFLKRQKHTFCLRK